MGLIFNHESGAENAYATVRQTNSTKANQAVILDVYLNEAAYRAGKPRIDVIEAAGPHDLLGPGNSWQKAYTVAKTHDKLKGAVDVL